MFSIAAGAVCGGLSSVLQLSLSATLSSGAGSLLPMVNYLPSPAFHSLPTLAFVLLEGACIAR